MLSEEVKKESDKYNKDWKARYKPNHNRIAEVHEQDHGDDNPHETPEPDLDHYYTEDSYPLQDSDIEELVESHGNYPAKMAFLTTFPSIQLLLTRANGGLAGADVHVLKQTDRKVSVTGIDNHELPGLDIVTCVALIQTYHRLTMVRSTWSCMNMNLWKRQYHPLILSD